MLGKYNPDIDVKQIMDNNHDSHENLIAHK